MLARDRDELPLVMREIADAMQARAAVLTIHPGAGIEPSILSADEAAGIGRDMVAQLLGEARLWPNWDRGDGHEWISCGNGFDVLSIPVEKIPGHSRLVISAFFYELDAEQRLMAEEVYLRRRPFAIGYFRLWQLDRTRSRRVDALEAALNLTDFGVLLMSRSGDLVFANEAGREILDKGEGLRRNRNTIRATELSDGVRLQVALDHIINSNGEGRANDRPERRAPVTTLQRPAKAPLIVAVLPTEKRAAEPNDVAAIIYVLDPARDTEHLLQPVCKLYHLSPVESRLTSLIAGGATLMHAAEQMRIKEQTARSYLKQIFAKTGATRQGELIRLMLSSLVRVSRGVHSEVF